jgi:alcohol dehydrogenase class IV
MANLAKARPLKEFGVREDDLPELMVRIAEDPSLRANPRPFARGEVESVLIRAIDRIR